MNKEEFIVELEKKVLDLHGPIIDVIHNNECYHKVEGIINFLLDYFLDKKKVKNKVN